MTLGRISLGLRWPAGDRLLLLVGVVALLATGSAFWLAWQAVNDAEEQVEHERLGLVKLAAVHADHVLVEAFFELEVVAGFVDVGSDGGQVTAADFSTPLLLLDVEGQATAIGGDGSALLEVDPRALEVATTLAGAADRLISESFLLPATGHLTVALGMPIFDDGGAPRSTVVGFLNVDEHIQHDLAEITEQFGESAHADIVDASGGVLASTDDEAEGMDGHHIDFYGRAASEQLPTVELVPHADGSPPHVVAYAPMGAAPWGVALGASEADTFGAPDARRRELVRAAIASTVTLVFGVLLVTVEVGRRTPGEVGSSE